VLLALAVAVGAAAWGRVRARPADGPPPVAVVDVNRADPAELTLLPGIGPALAGRIVADRGSRGPFARVEDLDRVPGIGPATIDRLRASAVTSGDR
jgi:competence protein ComEA